MDHPLLPEGNLFDESVGVEGDAAEELTEVGEDVDVGRAVWILGGQLHNCKDGIKEEREIKFLKGCISFEEDVPQFKVV